MKKIPSGSPCELDMPARKGVKFQEIESPHHTFHQSARGRMSKRSPLPKPTPKQESLLREEPILTSNFKSCCYRSGLYFCDYSIYYGSSLDPTSRVSFTYQQPPIMADQVALAPPPVDQAMLASKRVVFQYRVRCGCKSTARSRRRTVRALIAGTIPSAIA